MANRVKSMRIVRPRCGINRDESSHISFVCRSFQKLMDQIYYRYFNSPEKAFLFFYIKVRWYNVKYSFVLSVLFFLEGTCYLKLFCSVVVKAILVVYFFFFIKQQHIYIYMQNHYLNIRYFERY